MKKIIILLVMVTMILSCGNSNNKAATTKQKKKEELALPYYDQKEFEAKNLILLANLDRYRVPDLEVFVYEKTKSPVFLCDYLETLGNVVISAQDQNNPFLGIFKMEQHRPCINDDLSFKNMEALQSNDDMRESIGLDRRFTEDDGINKFRSSGKSAAKEKEDNEFMEKAACMESRDSEVFFWYDTKGNKYDMEQYYIYQINDKSYIISGEDQAYVDFEAESDEAANKYVLKVARNRVLADSQPDKEYLDNRTKNGCSK